METTEELEKFLTAALAVRGRLLALGEARAVMRQEGRLPSEAPPLGVTIDTDLADYGFSLLRTALALREARGAPTLCQAGFERAARAFEALVRNGSPDALERGFFRVIAGAAYHLAGYSAIAYAIFNQRLANGNCSPAEEALIFLILRDLNALREYTRSWLQDPNHSDERLAALLQNGTFDGEDVVVVIVNTTICRALSYFDFALQTGEPSLVETARALLRNTVRLTSDVGTVSLWWIARLTLNLIDDLWDHSLHVNLPKDPSEGEQDYSVLREIFLGSLYTRKIAEIELWPSQLDAARRSSDVTDNLVVALPTSAGKTRIAEIAALMTLSAKKRVLIVTPLRALSAQTERSFRRTFAPLGFSVSSLYGASGMAAGDEDSLRSKNIVIATPEKLDFALRKNPGLIDDVGLIVLDEGHLIGPNERELRYEILVQRLLRRKDATNRRLVCLSAVLPEGQQLDDLTGWIRSDAKGDPVRLQWRPTRQRFGILNWQGTAARLSFSLDSDVPFIAKFVEQTPAIKPRTTPFPKNKKELTLAAAWKFSSQEKRTLIFYTQRNHVEGCAKTIIELFRRGFLPTLLDDRSTVSRALEVGREWLGEQHSAVQCLRIGVAIHHARLPRPFLREVERLLNEGVLKVTVASPTLAQGLNLNAAVLLIPNLHRASRRTSTLLSGQEFANIAGRAGRAFVDVEGLIVHVIYENSASGSQRRFRQWRSLVNSSRARALESGLLQILTTILTRLARDGVLAREDAFEYLANSREAWQAITEEEDKDLTSLVDKLDTSILGLIEALDAESGDLPRLLDEALNGSLWARQIQRQTENMQRNHRRILAARAHFIWNRTTGRQRRGHFAMGVGLDSGLELDRIADQLNALLDRADLATITGEADSLGEALIELARHLLTIRPFTPNDGLPLSWEDILKAWINGADVSQIGPDNMRIIEDIFAYRLVWALEALRTRRSALGWTADLVEGGAAASLETGVPQLMMSMLIRAGLPSRKAAMAAIRQTNPIFVDRGGMQDWLKSSEVTALTEVEDWPTPETAALWKQFREEVLSTQIQQWRRREWKRNLDSGGYDGELPSGELFRVEIDGAQGDLWLCTPAYERLIRLHRKVQDPNPSLYMAWIEEGASQATIRRLGRSRPTWTEADRQI